MSQQYAITYISLHYSGNAAIILYGTFGLSGEAKALGRPALLQALRVNQWHHMLPVKDYRRSQYAGRKWAARLPLTFTDAVDTREAAPAGAYKEGESYYISDNKGLLQYICPAGL